MATDNDSINLNMYWSQWGLSAFTGKVRLKWCYRTLPGSTMNWLLCWIISGKKTYIHILYHYSTQRLYKQLKSFHVRDKDLFILHRLYQGLLMTWRCKEPGHQQKGIYLIISEYSDFIGFNCIFTWSTPYSVTDNIFISIVLINRNLF